MNIFIYFSLLILEVLILFGICVYGIGLLFSAVKGAPYVPTSRKKLQEIIDMVKPNNNDLFFELGSGDGRLLRYVVSKYSVRGVGIEVNPLLVWISRILAKRSKLKNITFLRQNIFSTDLSEADYIYIFLMPELIVKLLPKFQNELKKGTVIISHGFKIVSWEKKLWKTLPASTFSTYYYKI